jgi:hypothetical protein
MMLGDWGSRKASSATLYTSLASQSREFGDDDVHGEVIDTAREVLGWRVQRGVGCYERASRVANAQLAVAQVNRCDGWLQMLRPRARTPGTTGPGSPMSPTPPSSSPRLSPTKTDLTWCYIQVTGTADASCTSTVCSPVHDIGPTAPFRPASQRTPPEGRPSPSTWRNGSS